LLGRRRVLCICWWCNCWEGFDGYSSGVWCRLWRGLSTWIYWLRALGSLGSEWNNKINCTLNHPSLDHLWVVAVKESKQKK
jgi:hypothetical protein